MNRTFLLLFASAFGSLMIAGHIAAQVFDEPPTAAPVAPQAPTAENPSAQPVPPAAVRPPTAQNFAGPSGSTFTFQPRNGPRAVIGGSGGGFIGGGSGILRVDPFGSGSGPGDPGMAKLTQSEHELARQSHELISKYTETEDDQLRQKAKAQLRDMLDKQFDLQNQRRELELSRVEERLRKLREQLKRRNDARTEIVDHHLEHLISDAEGLGWTPPSAGAGNNPLEIRPFYAPGQPSPRPAIAR